MRESEKRSNDDETVQLPLALGIPSAGVGARQGQPSPSPGGGGYQDVCAVFEFQKKPLSTQKNAPRDPRMDDLCRMGLSRAWLNVSEAIGVDAFLTLWRILDADPSTWHNETVLRVRLRPYRSYLRYQRNRYIEALAAQGVGADEIKRLLLAQLGEDVSHRHITRLTSVKITAHGCQKT